MNDEIREAVKALLKEKGITNTQLAQELKVPRESLVRVLSGRSGGIPDMWQKILDRVGLEITTREKVSPEGDKP